MVRNQNNLTVIFVSLLMVIALGGCWQKDSVDVSDNDATVTDSSATEASSVYTPSAELDEKLDAALAELRMSLLRGDAELAPTYEEFVTNVIKAQSTLESVIKLYDAETSGQSVSQNIEESFNQFKKVNDDLHTSLLRGDAELAPTYEEFTKTVQAIQEEFAAAIKEYNSK